MAVMNQLRCTPSKAIVQLAEPSEEQSVVSHLAARLIQIILTLYLLPALMVVLVVGGVGILILKISHILMGPIEKSAG